MSQSDVMTNARLIECLDARVESQSKRIAQLEAALREARAHTEKIAVQVTPEEYEEEYGCELDGENGIVGYEFCVLQGRKALAAIDAVLEDK